MEFLTSIMRTCKNEKVAFVGSGNLIYYQKNGFVVVVNPIENEVILSWEIPQNSVDFFVFFDKDEKLSISFLLRKTIVLIKGGAFKIEKVIDDFETYWFEKEVKQIMFVGKNKISGFDLLTEQISLIRENKGKFSHLVGSSSVFVLFNGRSFQLFDTQKKHTSEVYSFRDKITTAALKYDINDNAIWVALGTENGPILIYKFNQKAELILKIQKNWHFSPVLNLCFSKDQNKLTSSANEDVLLIWDFVGDKADFLPRFLDHISRFEISSSSEFIGVQLDNGHIMIKKSDTFENVYEEKNLSQKAFRTKSELSIGNLLCFSNKHLKLNFYKYQMSNKSFTSIQANPTERNIISTINESKSNQYHIDCAVVSPDESILATSESLIINGDIVSTRLKIFLVKNSSSFFELMNNFSGPIFDEKINNVFFIVEEKSKRDFIRKPNYDIK